jgi:small-conductance mechanosensitive channel
MHARLRVYHPSVTAALRLTIYLLCMLGLLQLYGLNTFVWLVSSALGLRILSASGTLLLTIVLAFAAWEAINGGIQQHLDRLQRDAQLAKSARLRTLLPLVRTTLLITIAIVAGLMILSEIGINIAPLLAGAGIVGVAIGFGSQKLVQDLITGIFLLLENAMQVGDSVTVSGLSGVVEALSVRTIRLRAGDGSVHIIPFSSVTSVTNLNRGLGNAAISVAVAFDEDTDRVAAELTAIVAGMRSDPTLSAQMLSDLQLWGVDKVDGASVTVAGQVVCTDSGRWAVQREFNRRMKRRFQELGIRIFNPVQTIAMPVPIQASIQEGGEHERAAAAN